MSMEIKAHLIGGPMWRAERPDVVELTVFVRKDDLLACPAPLPTEVTLVVPEPIPATPANPGLVTVTIPREMMDAYPVEVRRMLLDSMTTEYSIDDPDKE